MLEAVPPMCPHGFQLFLFEKQGPKSATYGKT